MRPEGLELVSKIAAAEIREGPAADAAATGLPLKMAGTTAVVSLIGPMVKDPGPIGRFFGLGSTADVEQAVRSAAADSTVETILIRVDSPGGSVDGLAELGDAVVEAANTKPVIAQVDGMAASAAYYAIAGATEIRAGRMDLIGSIGTYMVAYDFSAMFKADGVEAVVTTTGPLKAAGVMGTEITDAQRAEFQRIVDQFFGDFKAVVAMGRGLNGTQLKAVTTGAVWTTEDAISLGLVDSMATLRDTLGELQAKQTAQSTRLTNRAKAMKMAAGS